MRQTRHNGNLLSHVVRRTVNGTTYNWTQTFDAADSYDGVNRLKKATEATNADTTSWTRNYGYDQFGNRWVASTTGSGLTSADTHEPAAATNFDGANRIHIQNSDFDTAGNQIFYTPFTLAYDAENRNVTVKNGTTTIVTFSYDGEGRRVKKVSSAIGALAGRPHSIQQKLPEN